MTHGSFCRGGSFICITLATVLFTFTHNVIFIFFCLLRGKFNHPIQTGFVICTCCKSLNVFCFVKSYSIIIQIWLFSTCPFPKQTLVFTCLQYKSFENTVGKGEIARNEQFPLFQQCFLPICRTFCHFYQI